MAYEIYEARQKLGVWKPQEWDWYMAELYIEVGQTEPVGEWVKHFVRGER